MRTELAVGLRAFEALEPTWRALEAHAEPVAFRTYDWARTWLRHFGSHSEPWVLLAGEPPAALLGLVVDRVGPTRLLRLIGQELSDYPGALGTAAEAPAWEAFATRLAQESRRYDLIDLGGLSASDAARQALRNALGRRVAERIYERCPIIDTRGTWEEFLQARSRKFRKNVRQAHNRVLSLGEVQVTRESITPKLFLEIFEVERESWKWEHGLSYLRDPRRRAFLEDLLASDIHYELWTCRIDGVLAGFALAFPNRRRRVDYLASFRKRFSDVGSFLLANMVRESCDSDCEEFDLGRGDESYKVAWATGERVVHDLVAMGSRPLAPLAFASLRMRWLLARSDSLRSLRTRLLSRLQNVST